VAFDVFAGDFSVDTRELTRTLKVRRAAQALKQGRRIACAGQPLQVRLLISL
jgi:hypothetical protein